MNRTLRLTAILGTLASGTLWTLAGAGPKDHTPPPAAEAKATMLDAFRPLVGTWESEKDGKMETYVISKMTAANSVYCETMFPGTPHEMTNMYHLDGDSVVITHYCAIGNQPRMRCKGPKSAGVYEFTFDSGTNITPGELYMGKLTVTIHDKDKVTQEWVSLKDGKEVAEHTVKFTMTRKKDAAKPADAAKPTATAKPAAK